LTLSSMEAIGPVPPSVSAAGPARCGPSAEPTYMNIPPLTGSVTPVTYAPESPNK
jgi:hypothetical protein